MQITNLKSYLATVNMTIRDFAKFLDYDPNHISAVMRGKVYPSKRLQKSILQATGGVINFPLRPKNKKNNKQTEQNID